MNGKYVEDLDARKIALDHAVDQYGGVLSVDEIVDHAEQFRKFLTGE